MAAVNAGYRSELEWSIKNSGMNCQTVGPVVEGVAGRRKPTAWHLDALNEAGAEFSFNDTVLVELMPNRCLGTARLKFPRFSLTTACS